MAEVFRISRRLRVAAAIALFLSLTSCATQPVGRPQDLAAAKSVKEARSANLPLETRAADYLEAAALTAPKLGSGTQPTLARQIYNAAAGEITILLRSADGGRLWNQPLSLTANHTTYHLRLQPAASAVWSPDYFTSFALSERIKRKSIEEQNIHEGVGGTLVGVRALTSGEYFAPAIGITAPVTATLDFEGKDATLALRRPAKEATAKVEGVVRSLAADFSAPISYHEPPGSLLLVGLMKTLRSSQYMDKTGLYFLQPYDPDRIPVVFVHGLMSTPFTWAKTINGLQADPEIRKHYQFWVFAYPTGNPILYSALRLREELAKVDKLYPNRRPYVLVGHSMGGILTQAQVTTVTRAMWRNNWESRPGSFSLAILATV